MILGIIIGLLILTVLVVVHELGHAVAARKSGVVVEEFGIGFPPRAWGKKLKNGILFSINWLPIGGFVKMQGEHDADNKKGDYGKATFWQKTKILFAGVTMNWLAAIIIFTVLAWTGMPVAVDGQFSIPSDTKRIYDDVTVLQVVENSPAGKAGIEAQDVILEIDGQEITSPAQVSEISRNSAGKEVELKYRRGDEVVSSKTTMNSENEGSGYLGIASSQSEYIKATWSAPIVGVGTTVQLTVETVKGLGGMVGNFFGGLVKTVNFNSEVRESGAEMLNEASSGVTGPVGIVGVIFPQAAQSGGTTLLFLAGIISISLAVMNILPIPALDGGRWLVTLIYKLRRKKLTKEKEENINAVGLMVLMGLILLITIVDITRLF